MKLTIIAKIRETRTRFLQPTHSECISKTRFRFCTHPTCRNTFLYLNLGYVVKVIILGITSVEPHLDLTKTQLLFVSIRGQFFIPPLNISVSTCPHHPNDDYLNIWEESEAEKLPISEHQVRSQGLSALLKANLRRNSTLSNNNSQPLCYWSY